MTPQTTRRSLVPRAAIVAVTVSLAVILLAVLAASLVSNSRLVAVPDVTGMTAEDAESAITAASLSFERGSTQVSVDVPAGEIISQAPAPDVLVAPGTVVRVVVSAGPQTLSVPDLVGTDAEQAREELERLGLVVVVETASSEVTSTIVLELYPAPGATVNVGDEVRMTVPGTASGSDALLPYDLAGFAVAIDPLPTTATDGTDVAMDVARRLQSLLEAAGASVTMTRSATETAPTPVSRAAAVRASGATVLLGIDLARTGTPGIRVLYSPPVTGDPARSPESLQLAQSITRAARLPGFAVNEPQETTDVVLAGFAGTGVRVVVADSASESDRARMMDPAWADIVARAIYRGVGARLGAE